MSESNGVGRSLEASTAKKLDELCNEADEHAERGDYEAALTVYWSAMDLLPEPIEAWEASTWLFTAIGEAYLFSNRLDDAIEALKAAVACPAGLGNPLIHLRLGQAMYESGWHEEAEDELMRAYMGGGKEIFDDADGKFFMAISRHPGVL